MHNIHIKLIKNLINIIVAGILVLPIAATALSQEQIDSFHKNGYLIIKELFNNKETEEIRTNLEKAYKLVSDKIDSSDKIRSNKSPSFREEFFGPEGDSASVNIVDNKGKKTIKLISWVGGLNPELLKAGRDQRITSSVSQLLGSKNIDHLINQGHYKKPGDGVSFGWHQDLQNRREFDPNWEDVNGKGSFVQVITAIDKVTNANGPLVIIPNSHYKDLKLDSLPKFGRLSEVQRHYPKLEESSMVLLMEPGDTLFMHPLILHKSDINYSSNSRIVFVNGFSCPGANKKPYPGKGSAQTIKTEI